MKYAAADLLRRYGLALASSGAVLAISLLLRPKVDLAVLPLFLSAVTLSAWAGGLGPGLVSTVLSSLAADYFFMSPVGSFNTEAHVVHLGEFALSGLVITGLTSALRRENLRRRQAQEELRAFSDGLERRLAERTEALQAAVKELDAFAYTVAHDLRAPLRAMGGFGEILLQEHSPQLDEAARDYARRVAQAAHRMDRLIQDLLSYTRLSQEPARMEPVELDDLCDAALSSLAATLKIARASVSWTRPLGRALACPQLAQRMLEQLLGNAATFTAPLRDPRVRIRSERRGSFLRLWVEDNGPGIPPAHQERVFGVFERLAPSTPLSGTGMGLAWVRRAAERLGGACGLESAPGEGTRVWIDFKTPPDPSLR